MVMAPGGTERANVRILSLDGKRYVVPELPIAQQLARSLGTAIHRVWDTRLVPRQNARAVQKRDGQGRQVGVGVAVPERALACLP